MTTAAVRCRSAWREAADRLKPYGVRSPIPLSKEKVKEEREYRGKTRRGRRSDDESERIASAKEERDRVERREAGIEGGEKSTVVWIALLHSLAAVDR